MILPKLTHAVVEGKLLSRKTLCLSVFRAIVIMCSDLAGARTGGQYIVARHVIRHQCGDRDQKHRYAAQ
jgi:hypothetical protein